MEGNVSRLTLNIGDLGPIFVAAAIWPDFAKLFLL
jgi:hypothetical protein